MEGGTLQGGWWLVVGRVVHAGKGSSRHEGYIPYSTKDSYQPTGTLLTIQYIMYHTVLYRACNCRPDHYFHSGLGLIRLKSLKSVQHTVKYSANLF
jgi:hypothetical protein